MIRIYFVSFQVSLFNGAMAAGHTTLNVRGRISKRLNEVGEFCADQVGQPTQGKVATIINYKMVGVKIFGFELMWG